VRIVTIEPEPAAPHGPDRVRLTVRADTGHVGAADASLPGRASSVIALLSSLAPGLVGSDPFDTEALIDRHLVRAPGRAGDIEATAVSLIEVACRDLAGRCLGLPVYRLLGGAVRDRIPARAVGWMPPEPTPEGVTRAALGVAAAGFRALAFSPFGPGPIPPDPPASLLRGALRLVEIVRAAVGPEVSVRLDLEGRLLPAAASRFLRMLDRVGPVSVADPVLPAHLPLTTEVPVSAGHRLNVRDDVFAVLARRGCATVCLDLTRCGGFTEAKKIAALAESHGVSISLRNLSGPRAGVAALHLAATLTNLDHVEMPADGLPPTVCIEGNLLLPDGPGL